MLEAGTLELLRMVADHIAYAIANARLFEIADASNQKKELENAHLREELCEARKLRA